MTRGLEGFVPGRIDCDTPEKLEMQLWISRHPALAKARAVYRQAETEEKAAEHALHVTYDLLEEQWWDERDHGLVGPNEGRLAHEVEAEEDEQERQEDARAREDLKARKDLKAAIAKYGVKVPTRKKVEKPAEEAPATPPESKP